VATGVVSTVAATTSGAAISSTSNPTAATGSTTAAAVSSSTLGNQAVSSSTAGTAQAGVFNTTIIAVIAASAALVLILVTVVVAVVLFRRRGKPSIASTHIELRKFYATEPSNSLKKKLQIHLKTFQKFGSCKSKSGSVADNQEISTKVRAPSIKNLSMIAIAWGSTPCAGFTTPISW
jgi:hypothetical protein